MSYNYNKQISEREAFYGADSALLGLLELLSDILTAVVRDRAERVYSYCNIKGSAAVFRSFYTAGDKAYDLRDAVEPTVYAEIEAKVAQQLEVMRRLYSYCADKMPSELFVDFDAESREVHALMADNGFSSVYDAEIRFKAWLEEHGGKGRPIGPRFRGFEENLMWKLFKKGEEKAENPTAGAVEIDLKVLRTSRKKFEKLQTPSAKASNSTDYGFSEGSGFLAIKDAFDERYPNDDSPDYVYREDVWELRDDYKLIHKDYDCTLYEYIAIYEDEECWHVVSVGMSELETERDWYTHYDAEYTMRIKKLDDKKMDEVESANAINLVSILADEAYCSERMLEDYSYVGLGFRKGMDCMRKSDKVAFIIVPDARISSVEGPFGTVHLRQAVPISKSEYDALKSKKIDVKTLYEKIGTDLVDYDRPSVI